MATGTIKTPGWKLVWTNPNPSSSFAAQTVNIDLSAFSAVMVQIKYDTGDADDINSLMNYSAPIGGFNTSYIFQGFNGSGAMGARRRRFAATPTGVEFTVCENKNGTSAGTTLNTGNIPLRIYAI